MLARSPFARPFACCKNFVLPSHGLESSLNEQGPLEVDEVLKPMRLISAHSIDAVHAERWNNSRRNLLGQRGCLHDVNFVEVPLHAEKVVPNPERLVGKRLECHHRCLLFALLHSVKGDWAILPTPFRPINAA